MCLAGAGGGCQILGENLGGDLRWGAVGERQYLNSRELAGTRGMLKATGQGHAATAPGQTAWCNNLRGQFFTDYNLLAAGSVLVALPTVLVFLLLQRHFIAGLTLGSTKG